MKDAYTNRGTRAFRKRDRALSAGGSSSDIQSTATLTVTGKTRTIRVEDRKFFSVATVGS